jgi:hypothetical protein
MNRHAFRSWLGLLLAAGLLCETGCSSKEVAHWGTAAGKVQIHGQPLTEGTIIYANTALGVSRMAPIQHDGSYEERSIGFAGLPVGKYGVAITTIPISKGDFVPVAKPSPQSLVSKVPKKYHVVATSGLTAEVKEGQNRPFDFNLEP